MKEKSMPDKGKAVRTVHITSSFNGCILNSSLLTRVHDFLMENGIKITPYPEKADMIIIGTCASVQSDEITAKRFVRKLEKKFSPQKKILVTGCLPDINPGFFSQKPHITAVGIQRIAELNLLFRAKRPVQSVRGNALNEKFCRDPNFSDNRHFEYYSPSAYYIDIARGCLNNCSYCVIRKAKGPLQSRPLDLILNEFCRGIARGYKEFVLIGDECGAYGLDRKSSFSELLRAISRLKGDFKLLFTNVEPGKMTAAFPSLKKVFPRLRISRLNLPVQSGNSRILRLMNRNYSLSSVKKMIKEIRRISPHSEIHTHFIYCFPSETRREFMDSVRFSRLFDRAVFFLYSRRKGTPAAGLKGNTGKREIEYRTRVIQDLRIKDPQKYYFGNIKWFGPSSGCPERGRREKGAFRKN